ncbi:MAG: hypothetical protein FD175_1416 [Beijerinckiaceae bacterium]|nr:MAG: hypothetical protein FD175_1416 [Beijerinckiaceae bacterium]
MRRHNAVPGSRSMPLVALKAMMVGLAMPFLAATAVPQANDKPTPDPPPPPPPVLSAPAPQKPVGMPVQIANLPLGVVTFPNGKAMNLAVAMGSAAFRQPGDAQGRLWLMTDRGPNALCADAKRLIGLEPEQLCSGDKAGRIYPLPGFVPSLYAVDIGPDMVARINVFVPLKGKSGKPISGRPTPGAGGAKGEQSFAIDGKPLPPDPSGIDPEAFVRLGDGSFWVAEEFGPSLFEVSPEGTIRKRLVPANAAGDFKDADYDIVPSLPPIMRLRVPNRGFEGLAISPDEKFLFAMMQAPLANPDPEAVRQSRNVRIWKIERETGQIVGQFLYQLDEPREFKADNDGRERTRQEVSASELVAVGDNKLLVLEKIDKTSRLFLVTMDETNRVPGEFDLPEMNPSLEVLEGEALALRGLVPLPKTLVLDTDAVPGLPAKIEGVAVMAPDELIVVNDSDFGIDGVRTQLFRITLPQPVLR